MKKEYRRLITLTVLSATLSAAVTWNIARALDQLTETIPEKPTVRTMELVEKARAASEKLDAINAQLDSTIKATEEAKVKLDYEDRRRKTVMSVTNWPRPVANQLILLADQYGISVDRVLGVISNETGATFNPSLVSPVNKDGTRDHGLMQLNDGGTLQWLCNVKGFKPCNPYNAIQNLEMGVWYLHHLNNACKGDWECARSRYNGDTTGKYVRSTDEHISRVSVRLRTAWESQNK